ncbi:MAG: TetR family transcriptional regulator C-terminal domain-containing protein [Myxococcota bacterium]|jgi:AcrR family transcriptional regulator
MLKAIAEHGLANCTMSDVAEAAGVSRGILHYYFKDKDEMISALVSFIRDGRFVDFKSSMADIADPWERLRASLHYPLEAFDLSQNSPLSKSLARAWIEFWSLASFHKGVHDLVLDLQRNIREHYIQILEQGVAQGVFRKDLKPPVIATAILASFEGLMLQWYLDPAAVDFAAQIEILEKAVGAYLRP